MKSDRSDLRELARFAKLLDPTFALPGLFSDARICPVPDDPLGVCTRHGYLPLPGAHVAISDAHHNKPSHGEHYATLPTLTAVKVMLYQGMKDQGIGKTRSDGCCSGSDREAPRGKRERQYPYDRASNRDHQDRWGH